MAWGRLPAPGTEHGPCADPCEHRDCAATRADASGICIYCRTPIGYDRPFFREDAGMYSHAGCAMEHEEKRQKQMRGE